MGGRAELGPGVDVEGGREAEIGHDEDEEDSMARPQLSRPSTGHSQLPLLRDDQDRGRPSYDAQADVGRRSFRRSTLRSRSPDTAAQDATRKKYTYAAFFLALSLVSFTVQTETAVYVQHTLGWKKAYCMLWVDPPRPQTP